MPGTLVFGANSVTPATGLADLNLVQRNGANLEGTPLYQTFGGTFALVGPVGGCRLSAGLTSFSVSSPADDNSGQNPWQVGQGVVNRLLLHGSQGATPPFFRVGTSAAEVDLIVNGTLTLVVPGGATRSQLVSPGVGLTVAAVTEKLGFFGTAPIVQPTLSTGAGATVDNVITTLQALGLVKQ